MRLVTVTLLTLALALTGCFQEEEHDVEIDTSSDEVDRDDEDDHEEREDDEWEDDEWDADDREEWDDEDDWGRDDECARLVEELEEARERELDALEDDFDTEREAASDELHEGIEALDSEGDEYLAQLAREYEPWLADLEAELREAEALGQTDRVRELEAEIEAVETEWHAAIGAWELDAQSRERDLYADYGETIDALVGEEAAAAEELEAAYDAEIDEVLEDCEDDGD